MDKRVDILGVGSVTIDDLLFVEEYPPADTKMPIQSHRWQIGGLVATALVTAARLGCSAAYAGMLGDDELSKAVEAGLRREGVDLTYVVRRPDSQPIHAYIVVARRAPTRTIFFENNGVNGADPLLPDESVIRSARAVVIDNWGIDGTIRLSRIAREVGIPVIADFEFDDAPKFRDLLALSDHLILSQRFAAKLVGEGHPSALAQRLWTDERQVVGITCGLDGSWYITRDDPTPRHQPAFPVNTVDSTGCGDVFHGTYAVTLVRGFGVAERMRFASAAAAIKATQPGGQAGIPTWDAVQRFLKERE